MIIEWRTLALFTLVLHVILTVLYIIESNAVGSAVCAAMASMLFVLILFEQEEDE